MINITDNSINKIYEILKEENNFNLKLRVFVQGGGCSGFQYGFTLEEEINEDDFKFSKKMNQEEIVFLIDPMSMQYLQGSTIDYEENLNGSQFIIKNPNAKTTCGCGSSFSN